MSAASRNCPVCEMSTLGSSVYKRYRGISFWFCSEQCEKRFSSRPNLYVGDPWNGMSVKQAGKEILKSHRIRLAVIPEPLIGALLSKELHELMGVKSVSLEGSEIRVTYDLVQISLIDIERSIEACYGKLNNNVVGSIRRALIHDSEECELDNLGHLTRSSPWKPRE